LSRHLSCPYLNRVRWNGESIGCSTGTGLNAGVAFYGPQAGADDVPKISAPLLLHYAGNDQGINACIAAYEAALKANNKMYTLEYFNKYLR